MSYVVQVWKQPQPADLSSAEEILEHKLAVPGVAESAELTDLAKSLWRRFPRDPHTDPDDPIWSDNSLAAGHDGSDLLTLGFELEYAGEILPEILREATRLGLVVYDVDAATLRSPGDQGSGVARSTTAKAVTATGTLDPKTVRSRLRKLMKPRLLQAGFGQEANKHADIFVRHFAGGRHTLMVATGREANDHVSVVFSLQTDLDIVLDTMETIRGRRENWPAITWSLHALAMNQGAAEAAGRLSEKSDSWDMSEFDDLELHLADLDSMLDQVLLPQLRAAEGPQGAWNVLVQMLEPAMTAVPGTCASQAAIILGRAAADIRYEAFIQRALDGQAEWAVRAAEVSRRMNDDTAVKFCEQSRQDFMKFIDYMFQAPASKN